MHEAAIMRGVVASALNHMRRVGGSRVRRVELLLSAAGHLTEEAVRQTFVLCADGTPAAGAVVAIRWLPATCQCLGCPHRFELHAPTAHPTCPQCGAAALALEHQDTCRVRGIDVVVPDAHARQVSGKRLPRPS